MSGGNLEVTTSGDREIAMTRVFHAPRQLVFEALTEPVLLRRWVIGPPGWALDVCELDPRPGGEFRYRWSRPDGSQMGMHGVFREATPERIVYTETIDPPWNSGETEVTTTLRGDDGQTLLTTRFRYASQEIRDGLLQSNMPAGAAASYDRLAVLLADMLAQGEKS